MSIDPDLVREAIERNDANGVRELLRDATEADRRACARALRHLLDHPSVNTAHRVAFVAATWGLASGVSAANRHAYMVSGHLYEEQFDTLAGVLADRRPTWLASLVDQRLAGPDVGPGAWVLARRLVRLGVIDRPTVPQYTTKMLVALHRTVWAPGRSAFVHPLNALLADPGLLEDEVWRLFTVPGLTPWLAEAWHDGTCWVDALAALADQGRLDRGRLLDACLDAFTRDFAPDQVGWYVTFHDRMSPSLAEMAARARRYIGLLAVNAKPAVTLGQRACGRLLTAGRLPAADFLAAGGPALLFPGKAVAAAQLRLLGRVAAADPAVRGRALAVAAGAFGHQRLDIQEAALDLIARHGLPEGPERLTIGELAALLAPALEQRATALGLRGGSPGAERLVAVPSPARVEPAAGDQLPPPLEDPGELIQLLTQLMEDASDALAVERAVAGAVRLCGLPVAERARLAGPLLKRAENRLREDYDGPFGGREIVSDIAGLTLAWGSGSLPETRTPGRAWGAEERETVLRSGLARTMAGIMTARIREAGALVAAGHPVELLAEPEFERGAIGPDRLLGRLVTWSTGAPSRHDLEIALLRLRPGVDDSFWSAWARLHPASLPAVRHAYLHGLGTLSFEPQVGQRDGHPVVVARITVPPGEADESRCWALLTALSRPLRDFYRDYGARWYVSARYQAVVAGWPLLCPWQPELAAAHLLRPLSESLVSGTTWAGTAAIAIRGLSHPGHPLGEIGHLALLTGLASAEPYVRIAAAEVWVGACLDGRLDPELAARAIVTGVTGEAFKLNRVADGLRHASHDPVAGLRIVQTVFAAADGLIPAKPANLHLLLELAARIGVAAGSEPPAAIGRIAAGKAGSQLAAAARRLAGGGPFVATAAASAWR